jgi:hypothetical protein
MLRAKRKHLSALVLAPQPFGAAFSCVHLLKLNSGEDADHECNGKRYNFWRHTLNLRQCPP